MAIEYEVKILDINVEKIRATLEKEFGEPEELNFRRYVFDTVPTHPQKWIRLRTDGKKTTLAFKHALEDSIDGVNEVEVLVSNFDSTLELLENLGLHYRNYEENNRVLFKNDEIEVSIDSWPKIPPYLEIEGLSTEIVEKYVKKLNLEQHEQSSLPTASIFKKYGLNIEDGKVLKF